MGGGLSDSLVYCFSFTTLNFKTFCTNFLKPLYNFKYTFWLIIKILCLVLEQNHLIDYFLFPSVLMQQARFSDFFYLIFTGNFSSACLDIISSLSKLNLICCGLLLNTLLIIVPHKLFYTNCYTFPISAPDLTYNLIYISLFTVPLGWLKLA